MPTQVYEESLPFQVEILEAISAPPGSEQFRSSYPFPALASTGNSESVNLPVYIIENDFLKVVIAVTLGGRILQIVDVPTGRQLFGPTSSLRLRSGGPRGVFSPDGLQWSALPDRLNDLGPVEFQVVEPESEDDAGGIWLAELVSGSPVSVHIGISLPADAALINLEMRTYNRGFGFETVSPHFWADVPPGASTLQTDNGVAFYDPATESGLVFGLDRYSARYASAAKTLVAGRFTNNSGSLFPRQMDSWTASLFPVSALPGITSFSKDIALYAGPDSIRINAAQNSSENKLIILTSNGQTLEAAVALSPQSVQEMKLGPEQADLSRIVMLNSEREEVLTWTAETFHERASGNDLHERSKSEVAFCTAAISAIAGEDRQRELESLSSNLGLRASSLTLLAMQEVKQGRFASASQLLQDAVLYNAEDHLAWWLQAVVMRHQGATGEREELLNAHYLAPLEPALRAESFLSQEGQSASLLSPFKGNPEAMVEVACLLSQCRLFGDLSRWVKTCLAVEDIPKLRYLLAAALLEGSSMRAEAGQEVALAAKNAITPPYPWRTEEIRALVRLAAEFPSESRIKEWLALKA